MATTDPVGWIERPRGASFARARWEDLAKLRFAQDHDMMQAFSSDRADEPFDMTILPRRPRRSWSIPNAHGSKSSCYGMAIRGVSVPNDVLGCLIPGEGLGDLAGDPFSRRIGGDIDPNQLASLNNVGRVIAEESFPALRWWAMSPNHVLSHGRLGDLDAEHKQLAVDARCTPQRVLSTDAPNKAPDIGRHSGSAHPPT